jgi:hypothetical protein
MAASCRKAHPGSCSAVELSGSSPDALDRGSVDEQFSVAFDHGPATERQYLRQRAERPTQAGNLREDPLRSSDHVTRRGVVAGTVPGADQAALPVDRTLGEVGSQMPTTLRHSEQVAFGVPDRPSSGAGDGTGRKF